MNGYYEYDDQGLDNDAVPSFDEFMRRMNSMLAGMAADLADGQIDLVARRKFLHQAVDDIETGEAQRQLDMLPFQVNAHISAANYMYHRDLLFPDEVTNFLRILLDADLVWMAVKAEPVACEAHRRIHKDGAIPAPAVRVDEFPIPSELIGLVVDDLSMLDGVPDDIGLPREIRYAIAAQEVSSLSERQAVALYQWLIDTRLIWRLPGGNGHQHAHLAGKAADALVALPSDPFTEAQDDYEIDFDAWIERSE